MSEEFEDINSKMPDFASVLSQRLSAKTNSNSLPPPGTVDPYQLMLQRKKEETSEIDPSTIQTWPEADVQKLQDYCNKMGIYGFNSGRIPPLLALAQLKKQFGNDYTGVPLEGRVPEGYEKIGNNPVYNKNYPYSEAMHQRKILHG